MFAALKRLGKCYSLFRAFTTTGAYHLAVIKEEPCSWLVYIAFTVISAVFYNASFGLWQHNKIV